MKIAFAGLVQACGPETDPQTCNAKLHLRFGKIRLFEASNNEYQIPVASVAQCPLSEVRATPQHAPFTNFGKLWALANL
jgi:hypothetical protein